MPTTERLPSITAALSAPRPSTDKSYDKPGRRTLGAVYAPHAPKAAVLIDFLQIARHAIYRRGPARARGLVADCIQAYRKHPFYHEGSPVRLSLPLYERLPVPVKWYLIASLLGDGTVPVTHALTVVLDDLAVQSALTTGRGPAHLIGTGFVNRHLEPIFRRAGVPLTYAYLIEVHRTPTRDPDEATEFGELDSYHATLLVNIPSKALVKAVEQTLAHWIRRHGRSKHPKWYGSAEAEIENGVAGRNSGLPIHIQPLSEAIGFKRGPSATRRHGAAGIADYAAKELFKLAHLKNFYAKHPGSIAPLTGPKLGASADVRKAAHALYTDLRAVLGPSDEDAVAAAGRLRLNDATDPLVQLMRCAEAYPQLAPAFERASLRFPMAMPPIAGTVETVGAFGSFGSIGSGDSAEPGLTALA